MFHAVKRRLLSCLAWCPLLASVHAADCITAPTNLVSWWPGDGSAADVASTNNGTLLGGATASAPGINGSCFTFDGTNSYVQFPDTQAFHPTNFTLETWVRFSGLDSQASGGSAAGDQYIIFKQNTRSGFFEGIDFSKTRVGGSDVFRFLVTSSGGQNVQVNSSTVISTGVWYHVALVRGPSTLQIYVNGALERQTNVSFPQNYGSLPLYFGSSGQSYWDHKFKGSLDEVALYNRPLSAQEIATIYASSKCKGVNIDVQPADQTVAAGGTAVFSVSASGFPPLSYQWKFNGTNVSGATASSLVISNAQGSQAGAYAVVVSNRFGAVTSASATLTVWSSPAFTLQPSSSTNAVGGTVTFTSAGTGTPAPSYQWLFNSAPIQGATSPNLQLNNIQPSNAGGYSVVLSNAVGAVTSVVAQLTVWSPPSFTLQPLSQTNVAGTSATFLAQAAGTPSPSYQWQFNGNNIPGATGTSLVLSNVQLPNGGNYSVVASNAAGAVTSSVVTLTIWTSPTFTLQPASSTNTVGATVTFTSAGTGTPAPSYQWLFNSAPIPGATTPNLQLSNLQASNAGAYSVVLSNAVGAVTSVVAQLTVWAPPSFTLQPLSQTNVAGTSATFLAQAAGTPAASYQWQFNGNNIPGATATTLVLSNVQLSNGGNYSVVASNAAGAVTSSVVTLTIWTSPTFTLQPASSTNTVGATVTFTSAGTGIPVPNYQWLFNSAPIPGATTPNLQLSNLQASNAGAYSVVLSNSVGAVTSVVARLTVWAPPSFTLQPLSQTNVAGTSATFLAQAAGTPSPSYQWQFNGNNIPGATATTLVLSNVQLSNGGNYSVVASNAAGTVTSSVAVLTIWATPAITSQPQSVTNITGSDVAFFVAASGSPPELSYQWQWNGQNIPGATSSQLSITNVQPAASGEYQVVLTNAAGAVTSQVATLLLAPSFIAEPASAAFLARTNAACFNTPCFSATFHAAGLGTPPLVFQWLKNGSVLPVDGRISGANSDTLMIGALTEADAGSYTLQIANAGGTTNSFAAQLVITTPLITDPNAEFEIATALSKPAATLSCADLSTLTNLDINNEHAASLAGLECALNLRSLYAGGNYIPNLSPLQGLSNLASLYLQNQNERLTSIAPLTAKQSLVCLNLGWNQGISDFAAVLPTLPNLQDLCVSGDGLADISFLASIPSLSSVSIDNNAISDLSALQSLASLKSLDASYNPLTNAAQAGLLTNLTSLALCGDGLRDISFLRNCTALTNLSLTANSITDLSPLASLINLRELNISQNPGATNLGVLCALTNLQALYAANCAIADTSTLECLTRLKVLRLDGNAIGNASGISGLANLELLDLDRNAVTNLNGLTALTNLATLNLESNHVGTAALAQLPASITSLNLRGNGLTDISALAQHTNLANLDLADNSISAATVLEGLGALECLSLAGNQISSLGLLPPSLTALDVSTNLIVDPSPIAALPILQSLNLDANPIVDGSTLAALTNLTDLRLAANASMNMDFISMLHQIRSVDVSGAGVAGLSFIAGASNLHDLAARQNTIRSLSELDCLSRLWTLDLRGNLLDLSPGGAAASEIQCLTNRSATVLFSPQNEPPAITMNDADDFPQFWPVPAGVKSKLQFTVGDDTTSLSELTITASSSTPGVLPDASVQITGTGATRFLNVTPLNPGSSVVTIFASDAEGLTNALVVRITAVQPAQVSIPDAALANVLSGAIGKPAGQLQNLDLLSLTALYAESSGITTLSGLEWASNLTALDLAGNTITNISTIQNLAGLSYLNLDGNPIGNAAPIGALTHLAAVSLDGVGLKDLAFLQPLGLLQSLSVMSNSISDITPISSLGNLAVVMLDFNTVTDLAALVPLPDLVFVSATMNLMDTRADSPAMGSILNLLARPLSLQYLPQRSAPTLAFPANWEIPSGARSFMSFAITPDFGASLADVRVSSANNARIPNSSLSFTMDNAPFWNLGATPAAQSGTVKLTVVATDNFGLSSTGVVTVTIFSSQSLADASFGPANLDWRTWGANSWFEETTNTHNGISAAQSGTIGNSQETWLTASVNGPGRLSFWWRTSSEPQFDWLEFYINQSLQDRISGESGWQSRVFNVPPGSNILAWHYTKDVDGARGLDAAWVSEVTFDPGVWLEIGVLPPNQGVQLTAYGIPGHGYEIDVSTNLLDWVPLESFTATNAATSILDSAGESTRFYRMRDLTVTSLGPAFPSRPWQPDDIIIAENSAATRRRGDL